MLSNALEVIRGSDHSITVSWKNADGSPVDFTGKVLTFFDLSPTLEGRLSGALKSPTTLGELEIRIEGTDPLPLGYHSFRFQLTVPGGDSLSSKRIYLKVV